MSLAPGTRLGPYEILSKLGSGGMGEVYRARDTRLGREVAIKMLPEEFSHQPERLRRFEAEARSASVLSDPHIVTVFDVGEADGIHYFASELVDGSDVRCVLASGAFSVKKALDLAEQIASGLAAAHEKGIIHRDLKPENILITKSGQVKIADFGLAKLTESSGANISALPTSEGHQTSAGVVLGTIAYMSPEQVRGQVVDHRSDIFSFGTVFYELLTGRKAFERGTAGDTIAAILKEEPSSLLHSGRNVPSTLEHVVEHCLEKSPAQRFQSARDIVFALREIVLPTTSDVPRPPALEQSSSGTNAAHRIGLAATFVVTVSILAVVLSHQIRTGSPTASPGSSPVQTARIVVLPFENLGSSEDAYFAGGITEEITSRLTNVHNLGVISRTTATEYLRKGKTVKQIGADLGVAWVLEGTIRCDRSTRGPGRVRITPRLIRVADDTDVWSERYDRILTDLFSLQSEVATKTVQAIGISLLPAERSAIETISTRDIVAYDRYLKGLAAEMRSNERSDTEEALHHYEAALERDPSFVFALVHLSRMHLVMYWYLWDRSEERLGNAKAAAEAAARLRPDLPESHSALGFLYYHGSRDYTRAIEEFETARRIRPNDEEATFGLASVIRRLGRWEESAALLAEAVKLDPRNMRLLTNLAQSLVLSRRYPDADRVLATAISLSPSSGPSHGLRLWLKVQWRGDIGRAKALLADTEQTAGLRDDLHFFAFNAYRLSLAERDFVRSLRRLDADSQKVYSNQFFFLPVDLLRSEVHHLTGRTDECRRTARGAKTFLEEELRTKPDDGRLQSALGIALALLGRNDDALQAARRGIKLTEALKDSWIGLYRIEDLAYVCALAGRPDEAIEQLGLLLSASGEVTPHVLRLDPRWDPLRNNAKFQALLAKYEVRS